LGICFWLSPDERTKISSPSAKTRNYGIKKRIVCFISEKFWDADRMIRKTTARRIVFQRFHPESADAIIILFIL